MKFLKNLSFHSVIISLVFQSIANAAFFAAPAFAAEITPEDPNIHVYEQNNANVIEIVEQNGSGLSHNKFTDYNAITKDQVINNSSSGGNSALAGTISGNSNFHNDSGSEASKILFEVKGSATMLQKDIEIFGNKQTDFILSNAKGIMCKGCGFINTSNNSSNPFNVSFIAGSVVDDGNPNNDINQFNIATNPDSVITIERNIVDNVNDDSRYGVKFYTNVTNFDLIARAVKIAGELKTANEKTLKNLNIQTGTGNFDYAKFSNNDDSDKKRVLGFDQNNIDNNQNNNLGEFSVIIDSTALGGARANQISIIATEEGAGVKTDAELISNLENVEITANGDIRVKKNITANNNSNQSIKLTTTNLSNNPNNQHSITIENTSTLNAKKDIILDSKFDIETLGNLTAQNGKIDFDAANNIANSGLIQGSNVFLTTKTITNNNDITATNQIRITADDNITNNDLIKAGIVSLTATNQITNSSNSTIESTSGNLTLSTTNGKIENSGSLISVSTLNLEAGLNIENSGLIKGNNSIILTAKNIINKTSATIEGNDISLTAAQDGKITNESNAKIQNQNNTAFVLNLNNSDLDNSGIIQATNSSLEIKNGKTLKNLTSSSFIESKTSTLTFKDIGSLQNFGTIQALNSSVTFGNTNGSIATSITNSGLIKANSVFLTATNDISNNNHIIANSVSLNANNITNNANGVIESTSGDLTLTATNGDITNSGLIQTISGNLTINLNGTLTNDFKIISASDLVITGNSTFENKSGKTFSAANSIKITAKKFTNNQELDLKGGFLTLSDQTDQGLFNNALITSSNSDLTISGRMQNAGTLSSSQNHKIILNSLNAEMINSGSIKTDGELQVTGNLTNKKTISRLGGIDDDVPLDVTNVNDRKYLKILIKSGTLTNDKTGVISTNNYLVIDGNSETDPNNPAIYSGNLVNRGTIRSNNSSDVNNFDDNNAIEIKNINILTNEGVIDSSEDLFITANELINQGPNQQDPNRGFGLLFASNNGILNIDKLTNDNANIITSFGDILIQKQIINNSDGTKTFVKSTEVKNQNGATIKTLKTAIDAPLFDEADIRKVLEQYAIEMLSTNNFSAEELTNRIYALRGFLKDSNLSIEEQVDQVISGNIKIHTGTLTNDQNSIISSNNYIKIDSDTINNNNNSVLASATYFDITTTTLNNLNNAQIYGATVLNIKAANENDVNNQISNSGLIRGSAVYLNTARLTNSNSQSANNTIESLFGQSFVGDDYEFTNNNLFIINTQIDNTGNNKFLIAINTKEIATTTNNSQHLDNFLTAVSANLGSLKILGDDIYLSQFISNLIQTKTNNRYITFDSTSDTKQLTSFLDTTKAQMNKLGIEFGKKLSDEQRANLTDPFIAFEEQTITTKYLDGNSNNTDPSNLETHTVYVPRIITPYETTIDEETSQIASKTASAIEARNELIINATQEVRNKGQIKAGTIVIETANFTNELDNQVLTLDKDGNLKYVAKPAKIEAKKDIFITAKENFNNIGADIKAGNALFVEANNINITAAQYSAVSHNYQSGNGWSKNTVTNNLYNISSNLTGSNIILTSKNDTNIIGSNLNATNVIQISAGNDLNIKSATDTKTTTTTATNQYQETYKIKKRRYGTRTVTNTEIQTDVQNTEIASNLTGANIVLSSGNDLNIDKSKITANTTNTTNNSTDGYLQISAGKNANIKNNSKINAAVLSISSGNDTNLNSSEFVAKNIYIDSKNKVNIQNNTINSNDLIATANGQISFRGNNSKVTGNLALINDEKVLNPQLASSKAAQSNLITTSDVNINSPADIIYEADSDGENVTGNLTMMTGADIINHSSLIASGDINLSATNITNSKVATTTTQGIWMGTIQNTTLSGAATIHAGGNVLMKATNDINNLAGTIIADSGDITLLAGNNVNIGSMQERYKVDVWGKFQYHYDKITNVGSTINAGNNIVIKAGNDANITGSNLTANNNIFLNANHDVNIKSSVDSLIASGNSRKSSFYQKTTTNNESNLTAGNSGTGSIYINTFNIDGNSGAISTPASIAVKDISNDVNIIGSNLTAKDDVAIMAGNNVTIASAQDTYERIDKYKKNSKTVNQTTQVSSNITAESGNIVINALGINGSDGGNVNIIASNLNAGTNINLIAKNNISILSDTDHYKEETRTKKSGFTVKKTSHEINETYTNVSSNLNAGNDLNLMSGANTNIIASNLNGTNNLNIIAGKYYDEATNSEVFNADAKINILNSIDSKYYYLKTTKTETGLNMTNMAIIAAALVAAAFTGGASLGVLAGMGVGATAVAGVQITKGTEITTKYDETVISSNLIASNINLISASDTLVMASNLNATNNININVGRISTTNFNSGVTTINTNDNAKLNIASAEEKHVYEHQKQTIAYGGSNMRVNSNGISYGRFENIEKDQGTIKNIASNLIAENGNINVNSKNDLNILASNLSGRNGISLSSELGSVNILNQFDQSWDKISSKKGDFRASFDSTSEQLSIKSGIRFEQKRDSNSKNEVVASNINTIDGNIIATSDNDINIVASNLIAKNASNTLGNGSINLTAENNLNILSASEVETNKNSFFMIDLGAKASISTNILSAYKTFENLKDIDLGGLAKGVPDFLTSLISGQGLDGSLSGNEDGINSTMRMIEAYQTFKQGPSVNVSLISIDLELAGSSHQDKSSNAINSLLLADSDINLITNNNAIGNKGITIEGSYLNANNNININSARNVEILASQNTYKSHDESMNLHVNVNIIGSQGMGATQIDGAISASSSKSTSYNNAQITAGNNINITSQNDTNIKGANVLAQNDLSLNVGNNLNVESLQNSSNSRNESYNFGVGFGGKSGANASLGFNNGYSKRNWVDDQTTLIGQNSVNINTGNNTNIVGALIANIDEDSVDQGNLTLNTKSLTYSDIYDTDKAKQVGLNIGVGSQAPSYAPQNASFGFNYSSHDIEQITRATIGNGNIIINGTNTNANPELIANLNRDINKSQEITKYQVVDPVSGTIKMLPKEESNKSFKEKLTEWLRVDKSFTKAAKDTASNMGNETAVKAITKFENQLDDNVNKKTFELQKLFANEAVKGLIDEKIEAYNILRNNENIYLTPQQAKDITERLAEQTLLVQQQDKQFFEEASNPESEYYQTGGWEALGYAGTGAAISLTAFYIVNQTDIDNWDNLTSERKNELIKDAILTGALGFSAGFEAGVAVNLVKGGGFLIKNGKVIKNNPLNKTSYTSKVEQQMKQGDYHSFPKEVDNYAGSGIKTRIVGADGKVRTRIELEGSYQGKDGKFEWIIEPDNTVNHRLFKPK